MQSSIIKNEYNGGLTQAQFLFYETKVVANLVCQGLTDEEIIKKVYSENLFQNPTEKKLKILSSHCLKRIHALNNSTLVELLAHGSPEVGKQINLYAMMKYNRIVWDFMVTVIGEKYRTLDFSYSKSDINNFFFQLQEQEETISRWSDQTISKIKQVLNKSLVECGYLDSPRSETLNSVYLFPEVEEEIKNNGDIIVFPAFNCFYSEG